MAEVQQIVTIGASMGGLAAITQLVKRMPGDLPVAVFIVQHMSSNSIPQLPFLLSRITSLKVKLAEGGEPIQAGTIYVSTNDKHLIIKKIKLYSVMVLWRTGRGFLPIICSGLQRAIGILLTGYLYDGVTIVQDPAETEYDEMPLNAIKNAEIDYIVPIDKWSLY